MSKAREVWKDFIPGEVRVGWKQRGLQGGSLKTGNHVAVCVQGPADVNELLRGERRSAWLR